MRDDQLIQDLQEQGFPAAEIQLLHDRGITTYSQLYSLLRDDTESEKLRTKCCWAIQRLRKIVDKRQAVTPLLVALKSQDTNVVQSAMQTLGILQSRRAVEPLIAVIRDGSRSEFLRVDAVRAISMIKDARIYLLLRKIIFDEDEPIYLRSMALEWTPENLLEDWIQLLSHKTSDIRFWAAYRLSQTWDDISQALKALDGAVAFDHTLPEYWGWHVDREAIAPLEKVYWCLQHKEDCRESSPPSWLISPAPEYEAFVWNFREYQADRTYVTKPLPPVSLNIDPRWLEEKLQSAWRDAVFDTRQPRPQAYLLNWEMSIDGEHLHGALHRDQYAIVLTGDMDSVYSFAVWYRSIFPPEQPLFLYEWASLEVQLLPGISTSDIAVSQSRYGSIKQVDYLKTSPFAVRADPSTESTG